MNVIELGPEIVFVRGLYRERRRIYGADGMTILSSEVSVYTPGGAIDTLTAWQEAIAKAQDTAEIVKMRA